MGLYFKLLGGPVFKRPDGDIARLPTRKSEALLAYLVERRHEAISREVLAGLLWPYSAEEQARASLRQEISVLRKALGADFADLIVTRGDRIELSLEGLDADVWQIRDRHPADNGPETILPLLELYTAPFLDTFRIRSEPFSDWVWSTRQVIETEVLEIGQTALRQRIKSKDDKNTSKIALHLCRIEPTYEPAHRALIENYLRAGDDAAAHRQLQHCEAALKAGLDVEVSAETRQLFETITPASSATPVRVLKAAEDVDLPVPQRRFITALSVLANLEIDDPEDFDLAANDVTSQVRHCIESNGGTVLRVSGDHVMACFGYPTGHDTDPDTAVFSALAVLDLLDAQSGGATNSNVGLAYGQALFSSSTDGTSADLVFSGPVFRAAEAICHRGPTASVIVNPALETVVSAAIALAPIPGEPSAKRALPRHQFDTQLHQPLVPEQKHPMVGRDAQFDHLIGLLEQAKAGQGSVAAIIGDAGAGKSRLVQEAADQATALGFETQVFQGNRSQRQTTFAPLLNQVFRSGALDGEHPTSAKIERWLSSIHPDLALAAPYIGSLIEHTEADRPNGPEIPATAKEAALNIFAAQIAARKKSQPLCMIFEDVHWFDPTTCDAISSLIDAVSDVPVLAMLVSRKDEAPDILNHPFARRIELNPLQPQSAETLLQGLLEGIPVTSSVIKNVLERAEGNPLVLEEFAKSIAFRQAHSPKAASSLGAIDLPGCVDGPIETPGRLLPLLLSRIDSLPGAIEHLQHASIFGRKFSKHHLVQVLGSTANWTLLSAKLEEAGIIFASTRKGDTSYIFKHALIGEAIYATIPKRERPAMHIAAAQILLAAKQRILHSEVAHHFKAAQAYEQAAQYFELSGDQAALVSAYAEAISEYREAIAMTEHAVSAPERLRKELALNRKTAAQLIGLHGIPTSEVTHYYTKAQTLSVALGDDEEVVNATWGLWSMHLMVAELDQCLDAATALAQTVNKLNSPAAGLIHHYMLGVTHAYRGSLPEAAHHLEAALSVYGEDLKDELQMRFGMDIGLTANSFLGWVYALLGRATDADVAAERALQMAHANDNGLSHVFANVFTATKCLFQDQLAEARKHAELAFKGADAMGFKHWSAQARIQLARIADLAGEADALEAMQQAREDYLSTGMVLARPYADVWVAAAQNRNGQPRKALDTLDALQKYTDVSNQKYFEFAAQSTRAKAQQRISEAAL